LPEYGGHQGEEAKEGVAYVHTILRATRVVECPVDWAVDKEKGGEIQQ
jgi:hypothetical protein